MKHRTLPFGYEIQNGIIQINKAETQTVTWIFTEYLNGSNLKEIAESLTSQKIEYMPDKYDWNKNRIKRIIEDRRYAGDGKYPKIISQRMFEQANAVKEEKRTTKSYMVERRKKNNQELYGRCLKQTACVCCQMFLLRKNNDT